ncbi:Ras-related and estrogen-regulated growth inhibitor, partial [Pelobates cultripes]
MAKSAEVKVAIFGRAGVGKSALVVRFLTKRFIWEYDPTLESTYRHQATIDDETVSMELLDTAGQGVPVQDSSLIQWSLCRNKGYAVPGYRAGYKRPCWANLLPALFDLVNGGGLDLAPMVVGGPHPLLMGTCPYTRYNLPPCRADVLPGDGAKLKGKKICQFHACDTCQRQLWKTNGLCERFNERLGKRARTRKAVHKTCRRSSRGSVHQGMPKMF